MTTPQLAPLIVLQPTAAAQNDVAGAPADTADQCCGGGSCSI
ncbi:hypothetical protein [uncultured Microbacterium sp.]